MALSGETEAGNAGMHAERYTGGLIGTMIASVEVAFRAPLNHIGSVDAYALKIAALRAESSLTENAASPFQAEPRQKEVQCRKNRALRL